MNKILENSISSIIASLGIKIGQFLFDIIAFAKTAVEVVQQYIKRKDQSKIQKQQSKLKKEIQDICNNGSLNDLLRKFSKTMIILVCLALYGCQTSTSPQIIVTNGWEGHFKDEKSFHEATQNIKLSKGESIWVLSNFTLSSLLINSKKGN